MKKTNWSREELIATLNLYFTIPFTKINYKNSEIINIAGILGRTPSAIALKLVNFARLDPELKKRNIAGMRHGGKKEEEIWNEFYGKWDELSSESERIMALLKPELSLETFTEDNFNYSLHKGIEKNALVKARVNQDFFRKIILSAYENKCCITGLAIPELLIASHIIPWSIDEKNRVNPHNGLCLNPLHDKAFDQGLITVTTDYKVKLSSVLKNASYIDAFFSPFENKSICLPKRFLPERTFLEYHNKNIFLDNNV